MRMRAILAASLLLGLLCSAIFAQQNQVRRGQGRSQARGGRAAQDRLQLQPGDLRVGELAPTFELSSLDGKSKYNLKDLRGEKPVVLFFGSYT